MKITFLCSDMQWEDALRDVRIGQIREVQLNIGGDEGVSGIMVGEKSYTISKYGESHPEIRGLWQVYPQSHIYCFIGTVQKMVYDSKLFTTYVWDCGVPIFERIPKNILYTLNENGLPFNGTYLKGMKCRYGSLFGDISGMREKIKATVVGEVIDLEDFVVYLDEKRRTHPKALKLITIELTNKKPIPVREFDVTYYIPQVYNKNG